ncbi:MAG: succinate--CoA ligase subunit beta [Deltaproteobacteria bacterium RIFCSPLOWO2_02_FULL_50_16]|nr:MAG: succinate--CoA ligase subunit beta [Deltaproteobacteria bacterium RIFCSPHIGHO2_02_FULL_50_15]OGQ55451.1 MAG: succinate--CoA ligase subunit beta [Deltaproteobacteria bacterium RIFCSPLOWO2_02_FULL_50_16]
MKIHEYQGKEILKKYGVPVPRGGVVFSVGEAVTLAKELGGVVVVKAQIHAGGRGKGGGVKLAKDLDEVKKYAGQILGMQLVTHQTGPQGQKVRKLLVEEGCAIEKEFYLGATLDRVTSCITIMASREGGTEIEEVAAKSPEKILKMAIDPLKGVDRSQAKEMGTKLGLSHDLAGKFVDFVAKLYEAYTQSDCSLAEINPLVLTKGGSLLALDAKINFDDNALFRHPEFEGLRDLDEENPAETEARQHDLSYISLDGSIGCMVNGAGLAMSTMDLIKLCGGEPANFLDVGGGADEETVKEAFKLILSDEKVRAILINIFGGIMKCDVIAQGVVAAAREMHVRVPVVVRLQGTNVDIGKKILEESGLALISEDDLAKAAEKVVQVARE